MDNINEISVNTLIKECIENNNDELDLQYCKFKTSNTPKRLRKCENLKVLKISDAELEECTNFAPNLEEIYITNCILKNFETSETPETVRILELENNLLEFFIECERLVNLEELNLSFNKLNTIPYLPKSIKKLNLSKNDIDKIENIENLTNLEELNLSDNSICNININILSKNISHLNLSNNKIGILDLTNFINYDNLKVLNVSFNDIEQIIGEFPVNLQYLNISQNKLTNIPKIHSNITYLDMSDNLLLTLPYIESYDNIKYFDITNNDSIELTEDDISKLKILKTKIKKCHIDQIEFNMSDTNNDSDDNLDDSLDDSLDNSSIEIVLSDTSSSSNKSIDSIKVKPNKINKPDKIPIHTKRIYSL